MSQFNEIWLVWDKYAGLCMVDDERACRTEYEKRKAAVVDYFNKEDVEEEDLYDQVILAKVDKRYGLFFGSKRDVESFELREIDEDDEEN